MMRCRSTTILALGVHDSTNLPICMVQAKTPSKRKNKVYTKVKNIPRIPNLIFINERILLVMLSYMIHKTVTVRLHYLLCINYF